jgi:hypothetical protein
MTQVQPRWRIRSTVVTGPQDEIEAYLTDLLSTDRLVGYGVGHPQPDGRWKVPLQFKVPIAGQELAQRPTARREVQRVSVRPAAATRPWWKRRWPYAVAGSAAGAVVAVWAWLSVTGLLAAVGATLLGLVAVVTGLACLVVRARSKSNHRCVLPGCKH